MMPLTQRGRTTKGPRVIAGLLALGATACALVSACSSSRPPVDTGGGGDSGGIWVPDGGGPIETGADAGPGQEAGGSDAPAGLDATSGPEAGDGGPPADAPYYGIDVNTLPEAGDFDAFVSCGVLNCSGGCCASDGTCRTPGTADTACGTGGNPCADCTLQTLTCNVQGFVCH